MLNWRTSVLGQPSTCPKTGLQNEPKRLEKWAKIGTTNWTPYLFYLKYIEPNIDSFDEQWWSKHYLSHSVEAWQGLTFELLCLFHISQIRKALNIGGVASEAYIWFDKADKTKNQRGAQIDLIIERADRVINLCEMKFSQAQYKISADYEIKLRNRMELFRDRTHCTKSLVNTFVTTFGVANGIHSSIVNSEVTLDNLFQEWHIIVNLHQE